MHSYKDMMKQKFIKVHDETNYTSIRTSICVLPIINYQEMDRLNFF